MKKINLSHNAQMWLIAICVMMFAACGSYGILPKEEKFNKPVVVNYYQNIELAEAAINSMSVYGIFDDTTGEGNSYANYVDLRNALKKDPYNKDLYIEYYEAYKKVLDEYNKLVLYKLNER